MDKPLTPQPSELRYLAQDRVFKWVMEQLKIQFRVLPASSVARSWEEQNMRAGEQRVIEAIIRLLGED